MENVKNVLVTTMSVLNEGWNDKEPNRYYYLTEKNEKLCCRGISSLEAGSKYFLSKYDIDEIVVIGTKETGSEDDAYLVSDERLKEFEEKRAKKEKQDISAYELYKYRITEFLLNIENDKYCPNEKKIVPCRDNTEKKIRMRFIPEQKGENIDNVTGIVEAIRGTDGERVNLYIDMQGGNRTSSYVRNAALSILSNQNPEQITIKEIVATNFNRDNLENQIVNETDRYRILDLASGMNAFIQYGKADMIQKYCEDMEIIPLSSVGQLTQYMVKIDEAISLCDVNSLTGIIRELREFFQTEAVEEDSYVGNIFHILQDGIRADYGKLLEGTAKDDKVDYLELIAWCTRKGFIQQALTLIEDKMPEIYMGKDKGVISYQFEENFSEKSEREFWKALGPAYENRKENKIFYSLERSCTEQPVAELLWCLKHGKACQAKILEKAGFIKDFDEMKREDRTGLAIDILKQYGPYKNNKIGEEKLNEIAELLKNADENEFIVQYCRFRRYENCYGKKLDLFIPENLYEIAGDAAWKDCPQPYFSILSCLGEKQYYIDKGKTKTVSITLNVHDQVANHKRELDDLFLLHEALKQERNCSNHASEKGIRLSVKIVKRAIEIYVKKAKEIMELV